MMANSKESRLKMLLGLGAVAGVAVVSFGFGAGPASAAGTTLYAFPESGQDGCYPSGTLFRDAAGALFGTTRHSITPATSCRGAAAVSRG
jgi:hypothetical protein